MMVSRRQRGIVMLFAAAWLSGCGNRVMAIPELAITSDEYGYHMPDSVPAGLGHLGSRWAR
jgi:hypothetical protein